MVSVMERVMARRQMDALIRHDPVMVSFERRVKVATPGGGWKYQDPPLTLAPQQVRLVPFKRRMTEFLVDTQYGEVKDLPYVLIGRYNLDVLEKDVFWYQGEKYEVQTIDIKTEIRVACHVDYFGQSNG